MEQPLRVLSESEAKPESFHDCHVNGLRWQRARFTFAMDLQYILKWIEPMDDSSGYRFAISEARLVFRDVDDLKVSMDWFGAALDSQIASVRVLDIRKTPNGQVQRYFEVQFADLDATISLWSTGYDVELLREPVLSQVTSLPGV